MTSILNALLHLALLIMTMIFTGYVLLYGNSLKKTQKQIGIPTPALVSAVLKMCIISLVFQLGMQILFLIRDYL